MSLPDAVAEHIFRVEGGYTDNPNDPGNWTGSGEGKGELRGTKYGISAAAYPDLDIKNLTKDEAAKIYYEDYWRPSGAAGFWAEGDRRMAVHVFDAAVNHGVGRAKRWAMDKPTESEFLAHRLRFYARLQSFTHFGRGWVNRMAMLLEVLDELYGGTRDASLLVPEGLPWRTRLALLFNQVVEGRFIITMQDVQDGEGVKAHIRQETRAAEGS